MNGEGSVHGAVGEGSRNESGTTATAAVGSAAVAAGLISAAIEQETDEETLAMPFGKSKCSPSSALWQQ